MVVSHGMDMVQYRTWMGLAERGWRVIVAAAPGDEAAANGLVCAPMRRVRSKFTWGAIKDLRAILREHDADAVFAASTSGLSTALFATLGLKTKVVGYRGTQARVRALDPTYRLALLNPRVSHVVCETADIQEYLSGYIKPSKLSFMPKPYDAAWVKDAVACPAVLEGGLRLCYVGVSAGRPHKGMAPLLEAMRLLKERGSGAHLTVVGNADAALMAAAPDNVTFMGNRADAVRYTAGCDVFVLSSTRDASPRVLREAAACGKASICTDIPGARDLVIPEKTAVLVPAGDAEAIAAAVMRLEREPALCREMGEAALANLNENYRPEGYVQYFDNLLTQLI